MPAGLSCSDCYGPTEAGQYLTGQFDPYRHPSFTLLASAGVPDRGRGIILRKETVHALKGLLEEMKKDLPRQLFWVQSGTRNFASQKGIWESKWHGAMSVDGVRLNTIRDPMERARRILRYSSMPGTSRHHWGTDFDINELTVDYYTQGGGQTLYAWMLAHAPAHGFCLVYTPGRSSGYQFEPWHWSYRPLSSRFLKDWETLHREKKISANDLHFAGSDQAFALAGTYASSVSAACR